MLIIPILRYAVEKVRRKHTTKDSMLGLIFVTNIIAIKLIHLHQYLAQDQKCQEAGDGAEKEIIALL